MRIFFLGCCLFINVFGYSQQFGATPPEQKWKQINTDSARIIYPHGLDSQASRIATLVHALAARQPFSLGNQLKKINIVLQHQTVVPNGYAGLGPFRSEFFITPASEAFNLGSLPWIEQLALHEYRHVQQFNNFNHGLSKVMKVLFGEDGYSLAINAAIPDWFYEGDAVFTETMLTQQGRGRLPLFLNAFPALWQPGINANKPKDYSWMKIRNGSLKDYVPSHYNLGYLMVNYGHHKYGTEFWTKVTRDAAAYKGLFYPFQSAVKRHAGISYEEFRKNAFDYYKKGMKIDWASLLGTSTPGKKNLLLVNKNYVTSYFFPQQLGQDSILYLKYSYRHRPAFYIRTSTGEHKVKVRDISVDNQYSYKNGKIVYTAYENDPRWRWRDYSVIRLLDTKTGRQQKLTTKTKYFTPDISPDGSKIVAVKLDEVGKTELHVMNSSDGQLIKAIHSADISVFSDPKFIDEKTMVTAVRLKDGKMALAVAEIETGNLMRLTTPSYNIVGYPSVNNGTIYFTASYEGNDDLFAVRLSDNKLIRITSGPLGNYNVNAGNGKITWTSFTAEGYQMRQMEEASINWSQQGITVTDTLSPVFELSEANRYGNLLSNQVPDRSFPVSDYKKSTGLLNFHSWRPDYSDPVFSFSIYGQNILNTLQSEIYYLYNLDEKTNAVGFNTVYGGFFPYLSLGSEYTFNRQGISGNRTRTWDQLDSRFGINIPLAKTSGQTYKNFNIGSSYVLRNEFNKGFFKDSIGNTSFSYLSHNISWIQQVERAVQHIYPKWAYNINGGYRHAISRYEGYQFFGSGAIYVPGFFSTHNLILSGAFQQRDTSLALFSTRFPSARGYADYYRTTAGSRLTKFSADYHLPLLYPDWGFGNILYLQRLRADLFYDHQQIYSNNKKSKGELRSVGGEFYIDTKWWNEYPLTFGVRFSHLLDNDPRGGNGNGKGSNIWEFVLPVNIIPR